MENPILRMMERLTRGEPVVANAGLRVIPLIDPEPVSSDPGYDLFAEAIKRGRVVVDEHGEGARVPELVVRVRGARPVLIPEGEILQGGLQTRTVNLTVLLPEGEHVIPVTCIEAGRWGRYRDFRTHRYLVDAEMRRKKLRSLRERLMRWSEPRADQREVWTHVARMHAAAMVQSETEAFDALIEAYDETIENDIHGVTPLAGQVGVVVEKEGRVLGLDVFGHPTVWQKMAEKVLGGYAMAARWADAEGGSVKTDAFLQALMETRFKRVKAPVGLGHHLFPEGGEMTGFALVHQGQALHLFAAPEG